MSTPLAVGARYPTLNDFKLAAWTFAGSEGLNLEWHDAGKDRLVYRCNNDADRSRDSRRKCGYRIYGRRGRSTGDWVVTALGPAHTCLDSDRSKDVEAHRAKAEANCRKILEALSKPRRKKAESKQDAGEALDDSDDSEQQAHRRVSTRQQKSSGQRHGTKETDDDMAVSGSESEAEERLLNKEVPYPRASQIHELVDECLKNGKTSLPLPSDKFDSSLDILAQLFAYAETNEIGLVIDSAPYRQGYARYRCRACHREPGTFQLEIQRNEHGVWTLAEKILHHKHERRLHKPTDLVEKGKNVVQENASQAQGEKAEMVGTERDLPLGEGPKQDMGAEGVAAQAPEHPKEAKQVQIANEEQAAEGETFPFAFPGPSTPKAAVEQARRCEEPAQRAPKRLKDPSPSPALPRRSIPVDARPAAKKPRITVQSDVNAPKQNNPRPRDNRLVFDHLDAEVGPLPFKDFLFSVASSLLPGLSRPQLVLLVNKLLIEKAGITSVSILARLAAFAPSSFDDFCDLFKPSSVADTDHSPLVRRFVDALRKAVATTPADAAQLA